MAVVRNAYSGAPTPAHTTGDMSTTTSTILIDTAAGWPTGAPFWVAIEENTTAEEHFKVTISGTTLSVVGGSGGRGADGTTAANHLTGSLIRPIATASEMNELNRLAAILTTRADLITANAATDPARLAVGTAGQVLKAGTDLSWGHPAARTAADVTTLTGAAEGDLGYQTGNSPNEGLYLYHGTSWRRPWNLPWGFVAVAERTADQTGISAAADVTDLTVTFTATANRYYRMSAHLIVQEVGGGGPLNQISAYITDATPTIVAQANDEIVTTGWVTVQMSRIQTLSAGSVTRKVRLEKAVGAGSLSVRASATNRAYLLVEDLGPSGAPS